MFLKLSDALCPTHKSRNVLEFLFLFIEGMYFICMSALSACISVPHLCAWYSLRLKEGTSFPRTGVPDSGEPSCGCCVFMLCYK